MSPRLLDVAAIAVLAFASACGPSTPSSATADHPEGRTGHAHNDAPACAEIAKACHPADASSATAHDCHHLGHNPKTTAEQCEAKRSECMAACSGPAPASSGAATPAVP